MNPPEEKGDEAVSSSPALPLCLEMLREHPPGQTPQWADLHPCGGAQCPGGAVPSLPCSLIGLVGLDLAARPQGAAAAGWPWSWRLLSPTTVLLLSLIPPCPNHLDADGAQHWQADANSVSPSGCSHFSFHNISLAPSCCIHAESRLLLTPIIQSARVSDERLTQDALKFKHLLKQDQGAGRAVLAVPRVADQACGAHGSDLPGQQVCVWRALQLEGMCCAGCRSQPMSCWHQSCPQPCL